MLTARENMCLTATFYTIGFRSSEHYSLPYKGSPWYLWTK